MSINLHTIVIKSRVWLILTFIIFFGAAAFFSSIKTLKQEEEVISRFKEKVAQIVYVEELFQALQSEIIMYFSSSSASNEQLDNISKAFSKFQESVIYFNDEKGRSLDNSFMEEVSLVNKLQSDIERLVPYIQKASDGESLGLSEDVLKTMDQIHYTLKSFSRYQIQAEKLFLSESVLRERRNRIFMGLSILAGSFIFLVLFLVHQNTQLERANKKNQEVFELANQRIMAIEASTDGIAFMDSEKKIIYMNPALRELHGISVEDQGKFIGKDWTELYNEKGKQHIANNIYPILNTVGEWYGESRVKRQDGKIIEAEMSLSLLPDNKGMVGTARDITHRRQAERENRALQTQVHQAQKMEAVGRLAGGMAHDFNNILAAIMGYAEFLSEDLEKDKKLKKFADNILMAGQKGRALIDQMLAFSRRKESQMSVVDLHEVIEETIAITSPGLPKRIDLTTELFYDKKAYVNGDASQVSQALMNIVVNAIDAMEDEKGEINISLSLVEPDEDTFEGMLSNDLPPVSDMPPMRIQQVGAGHTNMELGLLKKGQRYFQVSISDTGMGMAEAVMQHIFEPFFTTKAVDKGTGLGMANVHGAIVAHQGAMIVDSIIMEGTTFDLFFPEADHINDLTLLDDENFESRMMDFSGVRILLIDDQPQVLEMMETLLQRAGFECVSMSSALEALEFLREANEAFDMVIQIRICQK